MHLSSMPALQQSRSDLAEEFKLVFQVTRVTRVSR